MWILSSSLGGKSYVDIYIYITLSCFIHQVMTDARYLKGLVQLPGRRPMEEGSISTVLLREVMCSSEAT